jgi:hypothetical protein
MFGTFQQSQLRIEIDASATLLERSLTRSAELRKWLKFQRFPNDLPEVLAVGDCYTSWAAGAVPIRHQVEQRGPQQLGLTLSQTASLLCLKQFVVK